MQFARCELLGCDGLANSSGLCQKHRRVKKVCLIEGCKKYGVQKEMCTTHYTRALIYGLSPKQLSELVNRKKCDACGRITDKLVIDHDHSCCPSRVKACGNCVRGVLCHPCNKALGFLEDDPEKIIALLEYLAY